MQMLEEATAVVQSGHHGSEEEDDDICPDYSKVIQEGFRTGTLD